MKRSFVFFYTALLGVSTALVASAQVPGFLIPSASSSIPEFIKGFYDFALVVAGVLAVGAIVIGGIMYSISGAVDKKGLGKEIIAGALWGLLLLLGSYVILRTVNPKLVDLEAPALPEVGFEQCTKEIIIIPGVGEKKLPKCGFGDWPIDFETGYCKCYVDKQWITEYNLLVSTIENEPDPTDNSDLVEGTLKSKGQECSFREFGGSEILFQKAKKNGGRDGDFEKEHTVTVNCMGVSLIINKKAEAAWKTACAKIPSDAKTACGGAVKPGFNFNIRKIKKAGGGDGKSWSNHSWGTAADFNAWQCGYCDNESRKQCSCKTNLPVSVINAFKSTPGFKWGGDYVNKCDNMHFEWLGPCGQ